VYPDALLPPRKPESSRQTGRGLASGHGAPQETAACVTSATSASFSWSIRASWSIRGIPVPVIDHRTRNRHRNGTRGINGTGEARPGRSHPRSGPDDHSLDRPGVGQRRVYVIGSMLRAVSRGRTRCPRCPASRCTTRCPHRQAIAARVPRRARPVVRIRPQAWPGARHPRARCRPARQGAPGS
jgi:hypothetical protein